MFSPVFLSTAHIVRIHKETLREGGGLSGLRDPNALESDSAAPKIFLIYHPKADIWMLAAVLFEKVIHSHIFSDANKRTAFVAVGTFLRMNGKEFHCDKETALNIVVQVATHQIKQINLVHFFMMHCE